jgi:hypothetical protein
VLTRSRAREQKKVQTATSDTTEAVIPTVQLAATQRTSQPQTDEGYESWVFQQFIDHGFDACGVWMGVEAFKCFLVAGRSKKERKNIRETVDL